MRLKALLLGMIPLIAIRAQSVLPPPAAVPWIAPPECRYRLAEDFEPMTRSERAALYVKSLIGPRALAFITIRVAWNQANNTPSEWGQGARGFGYRAASAFGQSAISNTVESGLAYSLGEDNRYFASGLHGVGPRLKYAISSSFLARHNNGTRHISVSALAGPAAGAGISRLWQPFSTGSARDGVESFALSIGIRVGVNVARELVPATFRKMLP